MTGQRERRRHGRTPVNLLVQYRFDTFGAFAAEYIQDISEDGLSIHRPAQTRPVGTTVHLQFLLRDGSRLIEALGRVVRVDPDSDRDADGHLDPGGVMAVEFMDIDDESRDLIRRLIRDGPSEEPPTEAHPFGVR